MPLVVTCSGGISSILVEEAINYTTHLQEPFKSGYEETSDYRATIVRPPLLDFHEVEVGME
ncbi:hypothetical protein T265_07365 [Opisthorchis viverrini]|uniref:Uncharacterized protein n=1 Tax=Opisthorchis viverrini TaxID=6198 RepID=A0A075ABX1_OPIVI|nr:hypothetical protein T265_07365 [Opisthorchis viverrini]KER25144.1 hypothetical protein T265_07365 [Opisthorchis viverrini]